ncbi:hypothetical protein OG738_30860 [Amycolatopsis sp. NBC_01488]|uniref:hypothetical protein n=1 Tax=Amycolatopsis sp. NBC_01488 TaxID=2903563 RepID=UPI002E28EF68|nr:hypothetical protein [Amycolatopsis sp. NBC_01488]
MRAAPGIAAAFLQRAGAPVHCVRTGAGAGIVAGLSTLDAELFVVVEQDRCPCAAEMLLPIAVR